MKIDIIFIFRWIFFLPCAVIAYFATYFIFLYCYRFYADSDSWMMLYAAPVTSSLIAGFASILAGVWAAPSSKRRLAALIIIIIFTLLAAICLYISILKKDYFNTLTLVISLLGYISGYFLSKDDNLIDNLYKP